LKRQRRRVWIHRFQTHLFFRIGLYFVIYQVAVWVCVYIQQRTQRALEAVLGDVAASYFIYFAATSVVAVGLLFLVDAIKFTHRIVGPLYRVQKTLQAVTAGEDLALMQLRKGDFLHELKDEINEMLKVLEQRGAVVLKDSKAPEGVRERVCA